MILLVASYLRPMWFVLLLIFPCIAIAQPDSTAKESKPQDVRLSIPIVEGTTQFGPYDSDWVYQLGLTSDGEDSSEREALLLKVVTGKKSAEPADVRETIRAMSYLGEIYERTQRTVKAEALFEQAIAMGKKQLGRNDPALALPLSLLGIHFASAVRCVDASSRIRHSIAIADKAGRAHRLERGLRRIASIYYLYQCRYLNAKAKKQMKAELKIATQYLPVEHPALAIGQYYLGVISFHDRQMEEAEIYLRQAQTIGVKSIGPRWFFVEVIREMLANVYSEGQSLSTAQGHFDEAARFQTKMNMLLQER